MASRKQRKLRREREAMALPTKTKTWTHTPTDTDPPIYFTTRPAGISFRDILPSLQSIMNASGFMPAQLYLSQQLHSALEKHLKPPPSPEDQRITGLAALFGVSESQVRASLAQFESKIPPGFPQAPRRKRRR